MLNILQKIGIKIIPLNKFLFKGISLDTIIKSNQPSDTTSIDEKCENMIIVNDIIPQKSKTTYLQNYIFNYIKQKNQIACNINHLTCIAHLYDSGSIKSKFMLQNITTNNLFKHTPMGVEEYFKFVKQDRSYFIADILKYDIKLNDDNANKKSAGLNITNFLNIQYNPYYNTISDIKRLNSIMSNYKSNQEENYILTSLYKCIGDKSKRDFLWGLKKGNFGTEYTKYLQLFTSNDLICSMICSIDCPGSIIATNELSDTLGEGVEFIGLRENNSYLDFLNELIDEDQAITMPIKLGSLGSLSPFDTELSFGKKKVRSKNPELVYLMQFLKCW
jgi:hypothetical protein